MTSSHNQPLCLHVLVMSAHGLAKKDFFGMSDPYVKLALKRGQKTIIETQQTKTKKKTLSPIWNEKFVFNNISLAQDSLLLEVFDEHRLTRDNFLGKLHFKLQQIPIEMKKVDISAHGSAATYPLKPRSAKSKVAGTLQLKFLYYNDPPPRGSPDMGTHNLDQLVITATMVDPEDVEPLPRGWEERRNVNGRLFYVDHVTHRTQWERPTRANVGLSAAQLESDRRRQLAEILAGRNPAVDANDDDELPPGWEKRLASNGRLFYIDHNAKKTQWEPPLRHARPVSFVASPASGNTLSLSEQELGPLPPVWEMRLQPDGKRFFIDHNETAKKLFDEAMEKGYVESREIILLLIGAAGAGKSSFKHLVLRLSPPAVRQSTPLAEAAIRAISICRAIIGGEGMEWQRVSSEEMLHMVADAIKAGVSFRSLSPISFKSSSQPSSDTQHLLPPSTIQLEEEIVDLISQSSGSKKVLDVDWVYVVDSGGQPQFLEMLPAFIRYASACVFVTRLDESLTDHPTIEYYGQGGQQCGTPYPSLLSHEQILQHCSQALQSRRCTSSSPQSGPMVFVAGTHKDLEHHCPETRSAKNRKLLESLRPIFHNKLGLYRGGNPDQLIFPVNAKTPSTEDQRVASEFRKIVAASCPHKREQIPIPWFVLEQFIRQYAAEKKVRIVSINECRQIARRLHMNDKTFLAALDYLVALNIFHYYPTILPNVVFCDTQVLLDKISELVEHSHMLRGSPGALCTGKWLRFRDEGIITIDFLEKFPKHYVAGLFTSSDLLKLLQVLFIIAHLAGCEYFMPSLLKELQPEELEHYRCGHCGFKLPSPLLVHYPGGCLPSGMFTSLIAYLQNVCSWKLLFSKDGKPACLHRNCISFERPDGECGSVTLIDAFTHFEVHLASDAPVSHDLCSQIHRDIFDGLDKAADTLLYTNLHPKEAVCCSGGGKDCGPTPHPAEVVGGYRRRRWRCLTDKRFGGDLTEGQALWFSASQLVKAVPSPPPPPSTASTGSGTAHPKIALSSPPPPSSTVATGSETAHSKTGLDLETVDGTTVLDEDDLLDVLSAVVDLAERWRKLGISLRLCSGDLKVILTDNPHSCSDCLSEMLTLWLKQNYKVERFGKPTWRRLVEAVEDHVGGNNRALAQKIARDHPVLEAPPTTPH